MGTAEQFQLLNKIVDVEDKSNRGLCASGAVQCGKTTIISVLRSQYSPFFAERMEVVEFQPFNNVDIGSDENIFLLIVMNCLIDDILRSSPSFFPIKN